MSDAGELGVPIEDPDLDEDGDEFEEDGETGGGLPPVVKISILVLAVAGLGFGAFILTQKLIIPTLGGTEMVQNFKQRQAEKRLAKAEEKKSERKKGPVIRHPITGFTANLIGRRRNLVAFDLLLEVYSEEADEELTDKEFQIRDAMLIYFGARTLQEISTREFLVEVRDTIKTMLNNILGEETIDTVYFTKFIIQ
ncbi:MAG: flagellar basal body-associated FliL family protein [Candidatus Marinimicrobia bacterium]|nr:flagellar basal body-associated FliL family protein [Candidatus Neomarinimicrobiota bacterium]